MSTYCPVCPDLPKTIAWWNIIKKFVYKKRAKKSANTPMTVTPTEDKGVNFYKCQICWYGYRS